jgi:SET domain-containing protein
MNHCCEPNAYARVVSARKQHSFGDVDEEEGGDRDADNHIVIFATRPIRQGEEVMYDYKFPVEDVKLPCYCGASKCQGSMN